MEETNYDCSAIFTGGARFFANCSKIIFAAAEVFINGTRTFPGAKVFIDGTRAFSGAEVFIDRTHTFPCKKSRALPHHI